MRFAIVVASLFAASAAAQIKPARKGVLTAGVLASTNMAIASKQADAFAAFVQRATGKESRAVIIADYDALATALADGKIDVALMPPIAFLRAQALGEIEPLVRVVRNGQPTYRALLVAPKNGAVRSLEDLRRGKNLKAAWVDSSSSTGHIFPKALLLERKIDPAQVFVDQSFLGTHDAVCLAVASGKADIGATFTDDPKSASRTNVHGCMPALGDKANELVIVAASEHIPNDAIVVRPGFSPELKAKLVSAANALAESDEGKRVLQAAFLAEGVAPASVADYAQVRSILDVFKR